MSKRFGTKKRRLLVEALVDRDGMNCTWCSRTMIAAPITAGQDCSAHMTVEHMIPLFRGGTNELFNLALACYACNNQRGCSLDWRYDLG